MNVNRRDFIGGTLAALGFSALPGGLIFAAPPGWKHGGKPNLVFGVVSDTHLRTANKGNGIGANWERIWGEKYEPVWHKDGQGLPLLRAAVGC